MQHVMQAKLGAIKLAVAAVGGSLLLYSGGAAAIGPLQAYDAALRNDPTYRAAYYDSEAGKDARVVGRAGLLPSVSANYSLTQNRTDIEGTDFIGRPSLTHPKYLSRVESVSLRQGIVNLEGIARYKQGVAQSNYAASIFNNRGQELVLRVMGAYFDAAFASEQVRLVTAQRDTYAEQQRVNNELFRKGEGTKTDMLETQARLELSEAQLVEAADNETSAKQALAVMLGGEVLSLNELGPNFRTEPVQPTSFDAWRELALKNNPELQAQLFSVEAARQEINKNRSGHAPRIDFVASYSKNSSESLTTRDQESTVRAIGVQVNIPLYSGGAVNATTRQAAAGHEKAKAELQAATDRVLVDMRKQYNLAVSSVAKIDALVKAVEYGKLLVLATQQSIKGGVRINLDLLNAQQQLFSSQRDLVQARYTYLLSKLRLNAAAGTLAADDIRTLDMYFR